MRIKVFQALYSYYQNGFSNSSHALENLLKTLEKMHELFIFNLWFLVRISEIIDTRHELSKHKYNKSEKQPEGKRIFSDNICIKSIKNNNDFKRYLEKYGIGSDSSDDEFIRNIARRIENSQEYKKFQQSDNNDTDMEYLKHIYKKYIYTSSVLLSNLEEKDMHWTYDQYNVGIILLSYLKKDSFFNSPGAVLPKVFKSSENNDMENDEDFVKILFEKTISHSEESQEIINKYLENWEPERIALTDTIIMHMACAEIVNFNSIPVKVSLNEYIELSKIFSTPKSNVFINGVLDKVRTHFNKE